MAKKLASIVSIYDAPRAPSRPRRVLAYARVSSEEQAKGSSLDDQQHVIRAWAKATHGVAVAHCYVEAESAIHEKIERREQIRALMAEARAGDLVVCDKVDRWSRDPEFTYRSMRELHERGVHVYFVGESCDPSTPDGDSMLNFRVLFAREEHKRIKLRLVGTRKGLRDQGYYVEGLPPYGYRRSLPKGEKGREKNALRVEEHEAVNVRRVFAMCIAGDSCAIIAAGTGLDRSLVHDVLRNRVYLGEVQDSRGQWIKAKHEGIVDAETFARAQTALDSRRLGGARPRVARSETSDWVLRDLARCDCCGAKMGAAYAGPKGPKRRYYYRCSQKCGSKGPRVPSGTHVAVRVIEAEAEPLILVRLDELREELAREPERKPIRIVADFAARRAKLQRKRERYHEAFADGLMTREELRAKIVKLDHEALRLDAEEQAAKRTSPLADAALRRAALREVGVIAKAWARATPEERRKIVGHLATNVALKVGCPPRFAWRSAEELAETVS